MVQQINLEPTHPQSPYSVWMWICAVSINIYIDVYVCVFVLYLITDTWMCVCVCDCAVSINIYIDVCVCVGPVPSPSLANVNGSSWLHSPLSVSPPAASAWPEVTARFEVRRLGRHETHLSNSSVTFTGDMGTFRLAVVILTITMIAMVRQGTLHTEPHH